MEQLQLEFQLKYIRIRWEHCQKEDHKYPENGGRYLSVRFSLSCLLKKHKWCTAIFSPFLSEQCLVRASHRNFSWFPSFLFCLPKILTVRNGLPLCTLNTPYKYSFFYLRELQYSPTTIILVIREKEKKGEKNYTKYSAIDIPAERTTQKPDYWL